MCAQLLTIEDKIRPDPIDIVDVDADLDNMHMWVEKLPEVVSRVKELPRIEFGDINSNIRIKELPRIEIDATTTSTVNLAIKEIPDVRAHLPAHYNLGICLKYIL